MRHSKQITVLGNNEGKYASMQQALRELTQAERASGKKIPTFFDDDVQFAGFLDFVRAEGQRALDMVYVAENFHSAYRHKFPSVVLNGAGKSMRDEILAKVEEALSRLGLSHLLEEPAIRA
jgi:hypothetical protein